jgi:hypothetical protein
MVAIKISKLNLLPTKNIFVIFGPVAGKLFENWVYIYVEAVGGLSEERKAAIKNLKGF